LHNACAKRLFEGQANPTCPSCRQPWAWKSQNNNNNNNNNNVEQSEEV